VVIRPGRGRTHAVAVLAVLLAGYAVPACSTTAPGSAVKAGESTTASVAVEQLNPGTYPTAPSAPLGNAASQQVGREVEGRRMAAFVVGPWQVDPALTRAADTAGAALMTSNKELIAVRYPTTMYRVSTDSFIVGFSSERWAADPTEPTKLRTAVLRFPDADSAATVAQGWTDGAQHMLVRPDDSIDPIPSEPIRSIPIPGHPEVTGVLFTFRAGEQTVREVTAITGHGPFVLVQTAHAEAGADRAAELVGRALDLQVPLLDQFQPTPADQLAMLPQDPTGLVARTLPAKADPNPLRNGSYDVAGALHLQDDPTLDGQLFTDAGVDVVSARLATVVQTKDAAAARQLAGGLADAAARRPSSAPAAAVPGLPDSRCSVVDEGGLIPRYRCFATFDRYVFSAQSRQADIAAQQMAAQYRIFAAK
jgi:hypothetical protein